MDETNRYGRCKPKWVDVNRDEILTFLGIVTLMGIKKLSITGAVALAFAVIILPSIVTCHITGFGRCGPTYMWWTTANSQVVKV